MFFLPKSTYHSALSRLPQTQETFEERENLLKIEEDLFREVMEGLKRGEKVKARNAAEKYIKDFPAGQYHYEIYRVFRSQLEASKAARK